MLIRTHWIILILLRIVTTVVCPNSPIIKYESCERIEKRGRWCNWSRWHECEEETCTRIRTRTCACPKPWRWIPSEECALETPQDGHVRNMTLIEHTRYVRKTVAGRECIIPAFISGTYQPDCFTTDDRQGKQCLIQGNRIRSCATNNGQLTIFGLREKDIGACRNWKKFSGSSLTLIPSQFKRTILADSEIGQLCSKFDDDVYPKCQYFYLFNEHSRSDYGRLTKLAYDLENCRFACAISLQCVAFEFKYGFHCILAYYFQTSLLISSAGADVYTKPTNCNRGARGKKRYPFLSAMLVVDRT